MHCLGSSCDASPSQIDRYGVDTEKAVDKISRHLLEYDVITEGYGGQVPIVPVRELHDRCVGSSCCC